MGRYIYNDARGVKNESAFRILIYERCARLYSGERGSDLILLFYFCAYEEL